MVSTDKSGATTAREYLRVSVDKSGRERSPAEQHADNQRHADTKGWVLGQAYRDIGSASKFAKKARAGFDQLIEDLERGRFGASVLMVWESSRGTRRMSETVRLIELLEDNSVLIYVTSDGKLYDPANARDRRSLLEDGVDSEFESAKTSGRAKRARAADAAAGRPNGKVNFGYVRRYDPNSGRLAAQERHPTEAPIVEELFDRLHKGHSMRSIEKDFEARGIRSRSGKVFSAQHLRALATARAYVGEREHGVGKRARGKVEQTHYYEAIWPALVSREKFFAVQRILSDPSRVTIRPGRGKHLLSMCPGVPCDVCGGPLAVKRPDQPDAIYSCLYGGHVVVPYDELNTYVENEIIDYLARPDNLAQLAAADDSDLEQARADVEEIQGDLRLLADRVSRGELGIDFAAMVEPGIQARLKAAQAAERELSTPNALAAFVEPGGDVRAAWSAAPMSARRDAARLILVPQLLGEARVIRSPRNRTRVPIVERVVWRRE